MDAYRIPNTLFGMFAVSCLYPIAERSLKRKITPKLAVLRSEAGQLFSVRKVRAHERLVRCLEHAGQTVPYYRDLFAQLGFEPAKVRQDIRYLEAIPYLTKDILREQGKRLISEAYADKIVREQKTGSSTGLAAVIYYDQESLDWTAAQNILMLAWGGKRRYEREAHLSTRFADTRRPRYPEFEAKKCFVLNRYNIYTNGLDDASQEILLEDLRHARARVVQGHPSSMFALARYLKKQDRKIPKLFDIFVSTGEMLTPAQRELIENELKVRVSNRYGACEFGVMAQERVNGPKGELMVSDSLVWPELAAQDEAGMGELVFTNLRNPAMPLIRYRMGDLGCLVERKDGWWITALTGRTHDSVTMDGVAYPTHYIQDILDRCGDISDFQILVKEGQAVELRLVTAPENWDSVCARVQEYFPSLPARRIEAKDLVFVGVRGKFSYLVREAQ